MDRTFVEFPVVKLYIIHYIVYLFYLSRYYLLDSGHEKCVKAQ